MTPRSQGKIQGQLKEAVESGVTHICDDVAYVARVSHPLKQRQVDMRSATCSCVVWKKQHIPCRQMIAVLLEKQASNTVFDLAGPCHMTTSYGQSLGALLVQEDVFLSSDPAIQPAPFIRQAGKPRKRRIRSQGQTGGKARKAYRLHSLPSRGSQQKDMPRSGFVG